MTVPNDPPPGTNPPSGASGEPAGEDQVAEDEAPRTRIIRRAPTAPQPAIVDDAQTTHITGQRPPPQSSYTPQRPTSPTDEPSSRTAVAACAVSIISGWATMVLATDLIAGWWRSDRLFCVAVAFLAVVFALATVSGVIMLLQRKTMGRHLVVAGAVIALLTYGGVFIAGARVAWIVHALPLLPIASVALALHPQTKRWLLED